MTLVDRVAETPKPRTVLAFTGSFLPGYKGGGPIKSMVEILDRLPESVRVTLVTADRDLGDTAPYPGLSGKLVQRGPHYIYYLNWRDPRQWVSVLRWARRNPVDLVYVNSLWSPLFTVIPVMAHRLRLLSSREVLLAPRGELSPGALNIKSKKKRAFLLAWAPLLRRIDPVWHASTEREEREIHEVFPWARTVVQIDSRGDKPRECIVASGEHARFVFIGRISEMKNLKLALAALQLVESDVSFDIYGPQEDRDYWAACQRLVDGLPTNVQATYRGMLRPDQAQETFALYDGFILPTFGENFGHVIAESLSAGCPVICSDQTPWTDVLNRGGGIALRDLTTQSWANEIGSRARQTPTQRNHAKQTALDSYTVWRRRQDNKVAIETTLDNLETVEPGARRDGQRRIALITQGYQTAGGVQSAARWLTKGLRVAGFDVEIFDLATSRADAFSRRLTAPTTWFRATLLAADPSDAQVTHVGASGVEFEPLRYLPRAKLSTELNRFDLVQVVAGGPALALAALKCGRPVVLQVATRVAWERVSQLSAMSGPMAIWRNVTTKIVSLMERTALRRSDVVLVLNSEMQEFARSVGQSQVVLAPPGVDTDLFTPRNEGWDSAGYLLSVCRLDDARKGLDRLVRSYALMTASRPSMPDLVLAGRGELPIPLGRLIVDLGLADRVRVLSDVPQIELPSLYRGASVYLQSSHEEGLGISVIEAMACGLPVVGTETAGTRETIANGETGWLVPQMPLDQISIVMAARVLSVLSDDSGEMSFHARRRCVAEYSLEVTLIRFIDVYDTLTKKART